MVQHSSIDHSGLLNLSYASNSNDVAITGAAGASTLVSRADHRHRGVTSITHTSNTFYGGVTLTAAGTLGITSPSSGTLQLSATGGAGGGGSASNLVSGSYTRSTGNYTTTAASFTDIDATNLSITKTTGARRVLVGFIGSTQTSGAAGDAAVFTLLVDGTNVGGSSGGLTGARFSNTSYRQTVSFVYMTDVLSAGSHTFKLQWYRIAGSGTITLFGGDSNEARAHMFVAEIYAE